jgi:glucokinase
VAAAHALLGEHGASARDVLAAGVSLPGARDAAGETVVNPPNLPGWGGAPLRALLEHGLGARVTLENDANAAALAEWRYGAAAGCAHVVFLTMSTGVGGGLILGGRLHRGYANGAGEIGHVPLVWGGEPCACGLRGCVEAYIGGAAWTRRLAFLTPPASAVARLAAAAGVAPHPEHVVAAARTGDAFALAELERFNAHLAHTLCAVAAVVAPEIFVLGTIVAAAGEALCLGPVRERLRANVNPYLRAIRVEAAALGERLPLLAGIGVAQEALRDGA